MASSSSTCRRRAGSATLGRNGFFLFAKRAGPRLAREAIRRHLREIDVAGKMFGTPDRQLLGNDVPPVRVLQRRERLGKIGSGPVHLIDDEDVRHVRRFEIVDDGLRLDDAPRIGFDDDDGRVHSRQCLLRLFEEVDEARRIDDGDLDAVCRRVRESHGRRLQMRGVLGFVIGNGCAVGDRTAPSDGSGMGKNRLDERRLARVVRSDESDISKALNIRQCFCPL